MADNPYAKYAKPDAANPYAKYAAAPSAPAVESDTGPPVPLADEPGKEYGEILPFSRDVKTGKTELAFPRMIRDPVQIVSRASQEIRGERPADIKTALEAATLGIGLSAPVGVIERTATKAASAFAKPGAREAHEAGFVLPPAVATDKPGILGKVASGESGKVKLFQEASARNQKQTNKLAAKALGLPEDTLLTDTVFDQVRAEAGKAYEAVRNYVPEIVPDKEFSRDISRIGGASSDVQKLFPKTTANPKIDEFKAEIQSFQNAPTDTLIEYVKGLRFRAKENFKALGDPEKHALGLAQDRAAKAIDDLIDRNVSNADKYFGQKVNELGRQEITASKELTRANQTLTVARGKLTQTRGNVYAENAARQQQAAAEKAVQDAEAKLVNARNAKRAAEDRLHFVQSDSAKTGLVQQYRDARKLIAKTHAIESVTNIGSGDVSARGLARLQSKKAPLTDELQQIANSAAAFPKAFQTPAQMGGVEDLSLLDFAYMGAGLASHHPSLIAQALSRPVARKALMSDWYQSRMLGTPPPVTFPPELPFSRAGLGMTLADIMNQR